MDLILWRHAEAHDADGSQDDLLRGLTGKGERQAYRMAQWLNHVLPATTRILVSPAVRCQQTAKALDRKFKTVDALAPERSVDELLEAARWPGSREPVLVVGHQPTLGVAVARLVTEQLWPADGAPWRFKKGAVWWLREREDEEARGVLVLAVRSPELA
jgi:phosphohistidine phosphatase